MDRPSTPASAATVKKAGVGARPVSILRSVSAEMPGAGGDLHHAAAAAGLAQQRAEPLAAFALFGGQRGAHHALILIPVYDASYRYRLSEPV